MSVYNEFLLYSIIRLILTIVPWGIMALLALLALTRKYSLATVLELLGAVVLVVAAFAGMLLPYIISHALGSTEASRISTFISLILIAVGYLSFATGFCMNKLATTSKPSASFPVVQ